MRSRDLRRFYAALEQLAAGSGGRRTLAECHGRLNWPRRGVYFFSEPGEERRESGSGQRVVRVGTHALSRGSKATVWNRLSQHRGTTAGAGNHRGSIFRLLAGEALQRRSGNPIQTWGVGSSRGAAAKRTGVAREMLGATEAPMEHAVSRYLGAMTVLVLEVDDEPGPHSLRGVIERNSIALLSNYGRGATDEASAAWLGRFSARALVRDSGLWNQNHVDEDYDAGFLGTLERLIAK